MFCPKCGSILIPKTDGKKKTLACSCGYSSNDLSIANMKEEMKKEEKIDVVETDFEMYPKIKADCPKCGNKEAFFWTVQTRAADEPETKFFKCTKCNHTWRDYD